MIMSRITLILLFLVLAVALSCVDNTKEKQQSSGDLEIIPYPKTILQRNGSFSFDKDVRLAADFSNENLNVLISQYVDDLLGDIGHRLKIQDIYRSDSEHKTIDFVLDPLADFSKNGYEILILKEKITLKASDTVGLQNAWVTCRQLLIRNWHEGVAVVPSMRIIDTPDFEWRGVVLTNPDLFQNQLEKMGSLKINLAIIPDSIYRALPESLSIDELIDNYPTIELGILERAEDSTAFSLILTKSQHPNDKSSEMDFIIFRGPEKDLEDPQPASTIIAYSEILVNDNDWNDFANYAW